MRTPRPFPYAALPAISLEEIRTAARLRRASTSFVRIDAVAGALAELTGEAVSIAIRRTRPLDSARIPKDGVGVAFSPAEEAGLHRAALIDVEPALAANLVARALRQRAPKVTDASRSPSPEVAGALAAVLHAALRRAHARHPAPRRGCRPCGRACAAISPASMAASPPRGSRSWSVPTRSTRA